MNNSLLVRVFDKDKNFIGKGTLHKITGKMIVIKGYNLPEIKSKSIIFLNVFNELKGISIYECMVNIGASMQLTATILKQHETVERRKSLKVRTNIKSELRLIIRNNKALKMDNPIKITMLNFSIGGMLFTSSTKFFINDIFTFTFDYYKDNPIELEAKIIRLDKATEEFCDDNYGCIFIAITPAEEKIIYKYLYERQLQIYKKN